MEFLWFDKWQGVLNEYNGILDDGNESPNSGCHDPVSQPNAQRNQPSPVAQTQFPGYMTFSLANPMPIRPKRSKFNAHRRQEVAQIRRLGACLRCRGLKISCSQGTPCLRCKRSNVLCYRKEQKLRAIDPVPFSFEAVDIYSTHRSCDSNGFDDALKSIITPIVRYARHEYKSMVDWTVDGLFAHCWLWASNICSDASIVTPYSRSWAFSAVGTETFLSTLTSKDMCHGLRLLVEVSTLLYNWGSDPGFPARYSTHLHSIQSFTGSKLIQAFKKPLTPVRLANSSLPQLQGLFFLLFGAIIAVSHTGPIAESSQPNFLREHVSDYDEARKQLLRVLIHHMVSIGTKAFHAPNTISQDCFLEQASLGWGGIGIYDWGRQQEAPSKPSFTSSSSIFRTSDPPQIFDSPIVPDSKVPFWQEPKESWMPIDSGSTLECFQPVKLASEPSISHDVILILDCCSSVGMLSNALSHSHLSDPFWKHGSETCTACTRRPRPDVSQKAKCYISYWSTRSVCRTINVATKEPELPDPWDLESWSKIDPPKFSHFSHSNARL